MFKCERNEKGQFVTGYPGKEKIFSNPDELQTCIDNYFKSCDDNPIPVFHSQLDKNTGSPVIIQQQRPYTIEDLALYLGITRQTLNNYQRLGDDPYFSIITHAKEKISAQRIQLASIGVFKEGFTKFLLVNNTDYVDKSETTNKVQMDKRPDWLDGAITNEPEA